MEPSRFDDLTKVLATATSRRAALKTIAATAIGGILGLGGLGNVFAKSCTHNGHHCKTNSQCCSGSYCASSKCTPCPTDPCNTPPGSCGPVGSGCFCHPEICFGETQCFPCTSDSDCIAAGKPAGTICVPASCCTEGKACLVPC